MSNRSSPDNEWLDSLYPKDEGSPAHVDERIRAAAHEAAKPGYAKWYGMGVAATIVVAVMLTFATLDSPRDAQDLMSEPSAQTGVSADADSTGGTAELTAGPESGESAASNGMLATAPVASREMAERRERMAAEMQRAQAMQNEPMAKLAERPWAPSDARTDLEAPTPGRGDAAGSSLEEIVVTAAKISEDEWVPPRRSLPDCRDRPSEDRPVYCRADDDSISVFDPKSGDCPAQLPISQGDSNELVDLNVISDDPRTIQDDNDDYVCREGVWHVNPDSMIN